MTKISKCSLCLVRLNSNNFQQNGYGGGCQYSNSNGETAENALLNPQVSILYLVHNILDIPLQECSQYLEKYGNPADWVTLCYGCTSTLESARYLYLQLLPLQKTLDDIKEVITSQMRVEDEDPDVIDCDEGGDKPWITAAYEIRQYVSYSYRVEQLMKGETDVDFKSETSLEITESVPEAESMFFIEEEPELEVRNSPSPTSANEDFESEFLEFIKDEEEEGDIVMDNDQLSDSSYLKNYNSQLIRKTTKNAVDGEKFEIKKEKEDASISTLDSLECDEEPTVVLEVRRSLPRRTCRKQLQPPKTEELYVDPSFTSNQKEPGASKIPLKGINQGKFGKAAQTIKISPTDADDVAILDIEERPKTSRGIDWSRFTVIPEMLQVKTERSEINKEIKRRRKDFKEHEYRPASTSNPGVLQFSCTCCSRTFPCKKKLNRHQRDHGHYDMTQAYICPICSMRFGSLKNYKIHEKRHSDPNMWAFSCGVCNEKFAFKGELMKHRAGHENSVKRFISNAYLELHEDQKCTHNNIDGKPNNARRGYENDNLPLRCNFCSKGFSSEDNLKKHGNCQRYSINTDSTISTKQDNDISHSDLFICNVVNSKKSASEGNLKKNGHRKKSSEKAEKTDENSWIHTKIKLEPEDRDEKPLLCRLCCKAFITINEMEAHQQVHTQRERRASLRLQRS